MIEEPYRWVEAVVNRREYVEDQLASGSPVVVSRFDDGLLLFTVGRGTRKLFEVYDRIAFAGLGHPADIERMRLAAIDLAHIEGFNRSVSDVSLRRLVSYGISPALKSAFEQIFSAPYVVKMVLAELGQKADSDFILRVDYDGSFSHVGMDGRADAAMLAGREEAETAMRECFARNAAAGKTHPGLDEALKLAAKTWAVGMETASRRAQDDQDADQKQLAADVDAARAWAEHTKGRHAEAAVLERSRPSADKFRLLDEKQIRSALKEFS